MPVLRRTGTVHAHERTQRWGMVKEVVPVQQRRLEDRIRSLCAELPEERDHMRTEELSGQLRSQLHIYVEELRRQFAVYPGVRATMSVPMALRRKLSPLHRVETHSHLGDRLDGRLRIRSHVGFESGQHFVLHVSAAVRHSGDTKSADCQ